MISKQEWIVWAVVAVSAMCGVAWFVHVRGEREQEADRANTVRLLQNEALYVWHDDARGVTCYGDGRGIACIPDYEIVWSKDVARERAERQRQ